MFALTFTQRRCRCQIHFSMTHRCPQPKSKSLLHLLPRRLAKISISWISSRRRYICNTSSRSSKYSTYNSSSHSNRTGSNSQRRRQQLSFPQVNLCRCFDITFKPHRPQTSISFCACFDSVQSLPPSLARSAAAGTESSPLRALSSSTPTRTRSVVCSCPVTIFWSLSVITRKLRWYPDRDLL